jgi:hypothetical protein
MLYYLLIFLLSIFLALILFFHLYFEHPLEKDHPLEEDHPLKEDHPLEKDHPPPELVVDSSPIRRRNEERMARMAVVPPLAHEIAAQTPYKIESPGILQGSAAAFFSSLTPQDAVITLIGHSGQGKTLTFCRLTGCDPDLLPISNIGNNSRQPVIALMLPFQGVDALNQRRIFILDTPGVGVPIKGQPFLFGSYDWLLRSINGFPGTRSKFNLVVIREGNAVDRGEAEAICKFVCDRGQKTIVALNVHSPSCQQTNAERAAGLRASCGEESVVITFAPTRSGLADPEIEGSTDYSMEPLVSHIQTVVQKHFDEIHVPHPPARPWVLIAAVGVGAVGL